MNNNSIQHKFDRSRKRVFVINESDQLVANFVNGLDFPCIIRKEKCFADWSTAVEKNFGSIGVLEIAMDSPEPTLSDLLTEIHRLSRHFDTATLFAVGHRELRRFEKELLISGFSSVFCSDANSDRFATSAMNHWTRIRWPKRSIEQRVAETLPWNR